MSTALATVTADPNWHSLYAGLSTGAEVFITVFVLFAGLQIFRKIVSV